MSGIFDFGNVQAQSFDNLPAGWYQATVTNLEFFPTKDTTGEYLKAEFTVYGLEYNGRKVFQQYNLLNKSPKAQLIAMQQMKSLLIESGCDENALSTVTKEQLIELLINKQVGIKVKIQVDTTGQYGDKNVIIGYKGAEMPASTPLAVPKTDNVVPF